MTETISNIDLLHLLQELRQLNTAKLLLNAYRRINEFGTLELRHYGHNEIAIAHAIVLPHIDLEGTRLCVLAERAGVTKQSMTQLIQELHQHNYISRQCDPTDKRAQMITITSKGWQLLQDLDQIKQKMEGEVNRVLGTEDAKTLRTYLLSLIDKNTGFGRSLDRG
ncbi:transcriptional regulator [Synechococcus sp. PCC 7502]|uniref:MarR family winged helix-turn-helix transcriptional regulator n=1 Tax=Synechococcus sp. PCC 7502 TaxID=1173263 RepID=UPI00029FFC97|nr:MarR family transcriptional regulator [Synechococcus sp. PCC 7502]AFY74511.1 transcriptional regulator [Synechococcus sp. PCC 7502]